jgi:hypothetical protein
VQLAIAIVSNMLAVPMTLLIRLIFEKMLLPPTRINNAKFLAAIVQQGKLGAAYVKAHMGDPARASKHLMSQIRAQLGRKTQAQQQQDIANQQYQQQYLEQYQQYQQQYYPQQMMVDANGNMVPAPVQPAPRPPGGLKGLLAGTSQSFRAVSGSQSVTSIVVHTFTVSFVNGSNGGETEAGSGTRDREGAEEGQVCRLP